LAGAAQLRASDHYSCWSILQKKYSPDHQVIYLSAPGHSLIIPLALRIGDIQHQRAAVVCSMMAGVNLDFVAGTKEVIMEQPPARNLSAAIRIILR
jgi:hypothetical protein